MPPSESPLAKLEERIQKKEAVKEVDIRKAIVDELTAVDKLYPNPEQEFDKNAHKEEIKKFELRLLREKDDLYKAWDDGRLDFFQKSRNELWGKAGKDLEELKNRPTKVMAAYQTARELTDPETGGKGGKRIDDYEGWDVFSTRWSGTTDAHNPTRNALSGYLAAIAAEDPGEVEKEYAKAYKIFSDKWVNDLTFEDLTGPMGLGKYMQEVRGKYGEKLSNETVGYLCGMLKMANEQSPQTYESYRDYVYGEIDKLNSGGNLDIDPSGEKNDYEKDAFVGSAQISMLTHIQPARAWVEYFQGMIRSFEKLISDANSLESGLGFKYKDSKISGFMDRDKTTITMKDKDTMKEVTRLIANESYGRVLTRQSDTKKVVDEMKGKVDAYQGDNKAVLDKEMTAVIDRFNSVEIKVDDSPSELLAHVTALDEIANNAREIGSRVKGHEKQEEDIKEDEKEKKEEESDFMKEWKNAEWVALTLTADRMRVSERDAPLSYRNDDGTVGGTIPAGTDVKIVPPKDQAKEIQGIRYVKVEYEGKKVWVDLSYLEPLPPEEDETKDFVEEKHLFETTDGSKYRYDLGAPLIVNDQGYVSIRTGNLEIDERFAWRSNDWLQIVFERNDGELKKLASKRKFETINDVRDFIDGHYIGQGKGKEAMESRLFFHHLNEAYEHSVLQYETKPSLSTLKKDYDAIVLPAWHTVRAEAMKLPRRTGSAKKPEVVGARDKISDRGNELLDGAPCYFKYTDCINNLAEYEMKPMKYPAGATLKLPFNGGETWVQARYANGGTSGRVLVMFGDEPTKMYTFDSMKVLARRLNHGDLQWMRTYDVMSDEGSYSRYENLVGKLDFVDKDKKITATNDYQLHLEFDWEGWTDDPDIYVRPLAHGLIEYKIQWKNANHDGKKWRHGIVENFESFIRMMGHVREWGNGYRKIPKENRRMEQIREQLYGVISDPRHFRKHEAKIGALVSHELADGGVVSTVLDWGGGSDAGSRQNAKLSMWIGSDGLYNYKVERMGLPVIVASGTERSFETVMERVTVLRKRF